MATVTDPGLTLPVANDDIDAEPLTNWINNILAFCNEAGNIDEANVDLSGANGIVGKSTAQTISGAKTFTGVVTIGASDTGVDVNIYGDTVGKQLLWDQSEDTLQLYDNTNLTFGTGADADIYYDGTDLIVDPDVVGSGMVRFLGNVNLGVDGTGHDLKLFGDSAGAYSEWDQSADSFIIRGATAAGAGTLNLSTGELTNVDGGILGRIDFQAPLDSAGTDAILVAASIWAEANATFSASVNDTDLVFAAATSETAAAQMRMSTAALYPATDDGLALGITDTFEWSDVHLASGATITFNNSNAVITHSAGVIDVSTGALQVGGVAVSTSSAVTALNGATENELVTVGATTTELDAESALTFDGNLFFLNETANADMTLGFTINQGANDNDAVTFKSSDVAHPFTSLAEADTWGHMKKAAAASGGVRLEGLKETGSLVIYLLGRAGAAADTDDTTGSHAIVKLDGSITDGGTGATVAAATGNVHAFSNNGTTRVIFKGDGTIHASDTTWATALDDIPDALAARAYTTEMAHRQGEGLLAGMEVHASELVQRMEDVGIVTHAELPEEGNIPGHRFLNVQKGIKFAWDMGFQQMDYIGELLKVLSPRQRRKLPERMQDHFNQLERFKAIAIEEAD